MLSGIDRGASALILLQGGQTPEDAGLAGAAKVQQIVAESAKGKVEPPATTGPKARLENKVVENILNHGGYSGGTGIGDAVSINVGMLRQQEANDETNGIAKGDDANWEAAVSDAEWKMKLFINFAIRYNSPKMTEEAVAHMKNASANYEKEFVAKWGEKPIDDVRVSEKALSTMTEYMDRCSKNLDVAAGLDLAVSAYGQAGNFTVDEKGVVRVKTGDYKTSDGTRYMSIQEDGSITTYNKDGSIRRHETLGELYDRSLSHATHIRHGSTDHLKMF